MNRVISRTLDRDDDGVEATRIRFHLVDQTDVGKAPNLCRVGRSLPAQPRVLRGFALVVDGGVNLAVVGAAGEIDRPGRHPLREQFSNFGSGRGPLSLPLQAKNVRDRTQTIENWSFMTGVLGHLLGRVVGFSGDSSRNLSG